MKFGISAEVKRLALGHGFLNKIVDFSLRLIIATYYELQEAAT